MPNLSPDEQVSLRSTLAMVDLLTDPARKQNGAALNATVARFLALYPGFGASEAVMTAKLGAWCEELENYPLYAVKAALAYLRTKSEKEPSLAAAVEETRWRVMRGGDLTAQRQKLLGLLRQ